MKPVTTGRDEATVIRMRLAGQLLSNTTAQTPNAVVSHMGAIQAQDYLMAKWAIGIRLPNSTDRSIEAAFNRGEILRTHVLRPTWHLVTPANIRWMLQLSAPRIKAACAPRDRDLGITEAHYNQCHDLIQRALEGNNHLTRAEIAGVLASHGLATDSSHMIHYMMRAEVEGIVCSGALKEKKHTYALIDERAPKVAALARDEALAKLATIYITSHGPVTVADFIWWSGLSTTEAKQAVESVKGSFLSEQIGKSVYYFNDADPAAQPAETLHLLPAFDEYLVSYRDRSLVLPADNNSKAISGNGIFRPVVVADGHVVGIWNKQSTKHTEIIPQFFNTPSPELTGRMLQPQAAYTAFLTGK